MAWTKEKAKEYARIYNKEHRVRRRELKKGYNRKARLLLLALFGSVCIRCGFSDMRALQIDHINGGGVKHIKSLGGPRERYYHYIREHPTEFQLLCANCNWIKRYENHEDNTISE